ncbi:S41 family peptidase [uncultured Algibacter sp.]|uniref:S41 family peptidase n=1 Tax=uncultured Algibacter sp. TaxID=298659 RepID=UPI002617C36A|nr:S41 family peptidase [uncultured Algibacter sp.]
MKKLVFVLTLFIALASCQSIKKYNAQTSTQHTVNALRSDVDKLYEQLQTNHPKLYQYITKEDLDFKFDSLKKSINAPINSRELYKKLAPVVAHIRQGHVAVGSVNKRFTKKERKALKKRKLEFYDLDLEYLNNKLFVKQTFGKDSLLVGAELISIDGEKVNDLVRTYKTQFASDGYNTTLHNRYVGKAFSRFYYKDKGFLDSLQVTFKNKDSVFIKQFKRAKKEEKKSKKETVKTKKVKRIKLTKLEKKKNKLVRKQKRKNHKKYGFIARSKTYTRNFNYIGKDSLVAYMKIRAFSNGKYKKFYKESFKELAALKTKNLILDLRDNGGGRISEINYLYSYLTNKDYVFMEPIEVNTRLPLTKSLVSSGNPAFMKIIGSLSYLDPISLGYQYFNTKKVDGKIYYKMSYNKPKKPKKANYKGKLYVLINGNSFSASSLISTHLKANKRATFVGEETGGAYNGCVAGLYRIFKLPNAKLNVRMGLMQIEAPFKQNPDGYGIKPDVTILPNIQDRKLEIDTELEWILEDIYKQD